ncbi:MAG: hypothetical protein JXA07_04740 [Spirochaetes bacterium]|nr:hypothetical protein [Spirochaetota bacterium]
MELIGLTLIFIIAGCIAIATALSAVFIWIGSKFTSVPNTTFGKAFYAALLSSVAVWALTGMGTALFGIGSVAGWLLGIIITLWILKYVYATDWGKALLIWLFTGVAHVIVAVIMIILLVTGSIALAL